LIPSCATTPSESVGQSAGDNANDFASIVQHPTADLCGAVPTGMMRCHAKMRMDVTNTAAPQGFGPTDLRSAYNLPTSGGSGVTVAIVDAQDDPTAESDLAVYRSQYGLPPCTTANGCFKKVNESGEQGNYPSPDSGWAGEISLDLDMVSAVCPSCNILLVEANQAATADLGTSVNTAVSMGAAVVSNSYGGAEDATNESDSQTYYNHPGVLITVSAGDSGYGAEFPASSEFVMGVGGTSLVTSSGPRGWAEQAWADTGSGCSQVIAKPSFQTDTGCSNRTVADVSAVADPNTGVAVYVTYGNSGGWNVYGGTSAASPIVAATFALLGKTNVTNALPYANTGDFYDVTSGSNGSCDGSYLCTAGVGYDGPTGWGTPNGQALMSAVSPPPAQTTGGGQDAGTGGAGQSSGSATEPGNGAGASSSAAQDSAPEGQGGGASASGSASQDGAQEGSASQDSASSGASQGSQDSQDAQGSQDGSSSGGFQGSQDASSSGGFEDASQDGSGSGSSSSYEDGAQVRHHKVGRRPAWKRLTALVKNALD
jgi:hypothetical protein